MRRWADAKGNRPPDAAEQPSDAGALGPSDAGAGPMGLCSSTSGPSPWPNALARLEVCAFVKEATEAVLSRLCSACKQNVHMGLFPGQAALFLKLGDSSIESLTSPSLSNDH